MTGGDDIGLPTAGQAASGEGTTGQGAASRVDAAAGSEGDAAAGSEGPHASEGAPRADAAERDGVAGAGAAGGVTTAPGVVAEEGTSGTAAPGVTVRKGDPRSPAGRALLTASHAYLASRYPPEHMFALSIDELCAPGIHFLIAERGGRATGCIALACKEGYGEVKSMFVAEDARGTGTGAALVAALVALARDEGLPLLRLETGDDLYPAHRLYRRHGFTECGPFGDYREGPHSVFMERPLP